MGAIGSVRKLLVACLAFVAAAFLFTAPPANAQSYIKTGVLTCTVNPGIGLIVMSTKTMSCTFSPNFRGPEFYSGRITKVGIDVGVTGATVIVWVVLSKTTGYPIGALAGTYGGVSAEMTVGVGLGANVLIGGSNRAFALQPVSVQGQVGLDFAVGVTELQLFAQ